MHKQRALRFRHHVGFHEVNDRKRQTARGVKVVQRVGFPVVNLRSVAKGVKAWG